MPSYEYFSDITGEEKEIVHLMSENPEILDSKGNLMKRKVTGGSGYIMKGGTRSKSWADRYGGKKKKSDYTMTPEESATMKAHIDFEERKSYEANKEDPYHQFRDVDFSH